MGVLAITRGKRAKTKPFPEYPIVTEDDKEAVLDALESRRWARTGNDNILNPNSYQGYIEKLEKAYMDIHGCKYALAVTSGTTALELAIQSIGVIQSGDEVIVTPYSFIASASCILKAGAVPVFADINYDTWNIDPESIEKCITEKTKAIVVVHFAGQSAQMDEILRIAREHNLIVIGDAAHAFTSEWDGTPVGKLADISCFSLQSSKNLTCGEGGVLVTNNEEYYRRAYSIHMAGRDINGEWYQHNILGTNLRITELQAALACSQLKYNPSREKTRRLNAEYLIQNLKEVDGIEPTVTVSKAGVRDYHLFTFRYKKEKFGNMSRKRFIFALNAEGIPCHAGYNIPLYKNALFDAYPEVRKVDYTMQCPVAENVCKEAVWFHQNILLGDRKDMDELIEGIVKIKNNYREITRR